MGAACCVAARDKTIPNGSGSEFLHRNVRRSPTWSFRWDHHRGRVAGEDTSISWFSDNNGRNDGSDNKYGSAYASDDGSPESFTRVVWQKPSISEGVVRNECVSLSDHSMSRNISMDSNLEQVMEPLEFGAMPYPSPAKSLPSISLTTSPLSSQNHLPPASSPPLRWPRRSPRHPFSRQGSDSHLAGFKLPGSHLAGFKSPGSLSMLEEKRVFPLWNEPARDSNGASSDGGWSIPVFSDPTATYRESWSFDGGSFGSNREKITRSSSKISSPTVDSQSCGVCSKLLSDKSSWSTQKIFASNDPSVVAILICGHVYHAECLERMTPEVNKYDPSCPICTFGEKRILKLCEKALKAELELKRNKKLRNRVVDNDLDDDTLTFDHLKENDNGKIIRLGSSSSTNSSFGKAFLKRHFSFGSKGFKMLSDNRPTRKKSFFWSKANRV